MDLISLTWMINPLDGLAEAAERLSAASVVSFPSWPNLVADLCALFSCEADTKASIRGARMCLGDFGRWDTSALIPPRNDLDVRERPLGLLPVIAELNRSERFIVFAMIIGLPIRNPFGLFVSPWGSRSKESSSSD